MGGEVRGDSEVQKQISDLGPWYLMYLVMDVVNRQLIPNWIDWNYPYRAAGACPKLTFGAVSTQEHLQLLQLIQGAQQAGLSPSRKYYAKSLGIQQADPNDPEVRDTTRRILDAMERAATGKVVAHAGR